MNWDEKEEWRRKFLKVLADFRLLDDDFMTAAFQDSLECVDLVLQIILRKPGIKATRAIVQDTLKDVVCGWIFTHGRIGRSSMSRFNAGGKVRRSAEPDITAA